MSRETLGLLLGFIGVVGFAGTLPFTRLAVEGLDPWFVTAGRAAASGLLAGATLLVLRRPIPDPRSIATLALAALCVVVGFPAFIAFAMQSVGPSHGAVVLALLPLATAIVSTLLAGDRPSPAFWGAAVAGTALVAGFSLRHGAGELVFGDLLLVGAILSSALGYTLSGALARRMRGWEVISWILVIALPVTIPVAIWFAPARASAVPAWSWIGFAYVTLISQYLAFFPWNAGLALGGIARVSQVQLLQTFVTLLLAAFLNREETDLVTWIVALAVVALVVVSRRTAIRRG